MSWDQKAQCLFPNKMDSLSSTALHEMLQAMAHLSQRVHIIHRFADMKSMPKDKGTDDDTISIPWRFDLSIQS